VDTAATEDGEGTASSGDAETAGTERSCRADVSTVGDVLPRAVALDHLEPFLARPLCFLGVWLDEDDLVLALSDGTGGPEADPARTHYDESHSSHYVEGWNKAILAGQHAPPRYQRSLEGNSAQVGCERLPGIGQQQGTTVVLTTTTTTDRAQINAVSRRRYRLRYPFVSG
jgi:hypothetical protein